LADRGVVVHAINPKQLDRFEPYRVCRRLHSLRGWSYDEEDFESIFT
jgi:hypothetical protein